MVMMIFELVMMIKTIMMLRMGLMMMMTMIMRMMMMMMAVRFVQIYISVPGGGVTGGYSGFQVTGMIEWGQKSKLKKFL